MQLMASFKPAIVQNQSLTGFTVYINMSEAKKEASFKGCTNDFNISSLVM